MITWKLLTDKGMRDHNEDMIGSRQIGNRYCFVLADGLGGHGKGEVASRLVVNEILAEFETYATAEEFLKRALLRAQTALRQEQEAMNCSSEMKTTVVCLVVDEKQMQWAFCGDSRLYYIYKNKIRQRTIDHSVPQVLALSKQIKEKDIRFHEDRNRLLRVLGTEDNGKQMFEIMPPVARKGKQKFLMCSDGFWEYIFEKDMEKLLKTSKTSEEWIQQMQKAVLENGRGHDMDNYSAIAVWVDEK